MKNINKFKLSTENDIKASIMQRRLSYSGNIEVIEEKSKKKNIRSNLLGVLNQEELPRDPNASDEPNISSFKLEEEVILEEHEEKKIQEEFEKNESEIAKSLYESINKRIIIIILIILFTAPLLRVSTYYNNSNAYEHTISLIAKMNSLGYYHTSQSIRDIFVNKFKDDIIHFREGSYTYGSNESINSLRNIEFMYISYDNIDLYISLRHFVIVNSSLALVFSLIVIIILIGTIFLFYNDTNQLLIVPIEKMLRTINKIEKNPIGAIQKEEDEAVAIQNIQKVNTDENKCCSNETKDTNPLETSILESAVVKAGSLIVMGYGDAGTKIIIRNMQSKGEFDPICRGQHMGGIFCLCDIRNFTDTTEILQENVMIFVNEIAEIVHESTVFYKGLPSKNIGDAFLLVWKFSPNDFKIENGKLVVVNEKEICKMADLSILATLKILIGVEKSGTLLKYRLNENLNKKFQNYSVKIGFGLNIGLGISGAIGSESKIDCSYFSKDVKMVDFFETATKTYRTQVTINSSLYNSLSETMKSYFRIYDHCVNSKTREKFDVYGIDLDFKEIARPFQYNARKEDVFENRIKRMKIRMESDNLMKDIFSGAKSVKNIVENDKELNIVHKIYNSEFLNLYNEGINLYKSKNWEEAITKFQEALKIMSDDYPSQFLLNYMKDKNFEFLKNWEGREI